MKELYTIVELPYDNAITVSDENTQITIALQEYPDEKYEEFKSVLGKWNLIKITRDECGTEYRGELIDFSPSTKKERETLCAKNILIKNDKAVGFVLGRKHFTYWKTPDDVVLMFFDGTHVGSITHRESEAWEYEASEIHFIDTDYSYELVSLD